MTMRPDIPLQPPNGRIDGTAHHFALRVYYEDTDAGGIVYHANYLRWFERARTDMLDLLGVDQRAVLDAGEGAYAVMQLAISYLRPARLGDAVLIESHVTQLGAASWRMNQCALRGDEILAKAELRIGFITPDARPARQPAAWHRALHSILSAESIV